jgi:GntR family transcriptional regulator/MocR family aminotransferase
MKYIIDEKSNIPAYLQLYHYFRDDIVQGVYPFKTKLPSKRITCAETGLSAITVEHAYELLIQEGYIESKERSGYFVVFQPNIGFASFSKVEHVQKTNFDIENSNNDYTFPFNPIAKAMRKVINDFEEDILTRSQNVGCYELRKNICLYLARSRGILTTPEQIVIGAGSEYLYNLISILLGHDNTIAIESPSYKQIEQVYKSLDINFVKLKLGHDGIDSSKLWNCDANILHVSPYRSFPSGVSASASKKHEYLSWANKKGKYIIEDDFESEFSISKKPEETLFATTKMDNVIYLNTFSKTISSSLRVGYMVLPTKLIKVFEEKLGFYSCTVPTYIQYLIAELIANGDFERHINRVRRKKRLESKM